MTRRLVINLAILLLAGCATNSHSPSGGTFQFGLLSGSTPGTLRVDVETTSLPVRRDTPTPYYGFYLNQPQLEPFSLQTIMYPPAAPVAVPKSWISKPEDFASGLKSQIRTVNGPLLTGYIFNDGDPPGEYRLDIVINGKLWRSIKYSIQEK